MNILTIVIFIVLILVGIFLAGYYGYKHFDKHEKSTLNEILFAVGVILVIVGFLGAIFTIIRSRKGKSKAKMETEMMEMSPTQPLYPIQQTMPSYPNLPQSYPGQQMMPPYPAVQGYPGQQMMPGYPGLPQTYPSPQYPGPQY